MNKVKSLLIVLVFSFSLMSCGDEENNPLGLPLKDNGYFVVNEGAFGNSNTSLSFYSYNTGEITNDIFQLVNERPLGDQSQSMTIHREEGFIVVQNSAKVEVIDVDNFESIATITEGVESPRYIVVLDNDKAYLSDWGEDLASGSVKVIDLDTYTITKTIPTGTGSNEMIIRDGFLYVANGGVFTPDNTIDVINTDTDEVVETIELGDNPNNFEMDNDGNIWVLGKGNLAFDDEFNIVVEESTLGYLSRINANNLVDLTIELPTATFSSADDLTIDIDSDMLYFNYNGGVWAVETSSTTLGSEPLINRSLYGLAYSERDGNLLGTEAPDFSSRGNLYIFGTDGSENGVFETGIAPNSCVFKN